MGQYHFVCNLDKKEFLHPHKLGDGLKLMEFGCSAVGTLTGLTLLLAASNGEQGRGGGDYRYEDTHGIVGRWAGDRIAIIGDYWDDNDIPNYDTKDNPWNTADFDVEYRPGWTDISLEVRATVEKDSRMAPRWDVF
jgi:hypothetical protein